MPSRQHHRQRKTRRETQRSGRRRDAIREAHRRRKARCGAGAPALDHDEGDTVDNQRGGNHHGAVKVLLHKVIQRDSDNRGGDAAQHDLAPQTPSGAPSVFSLFGRERVELMEEQQADGKNRTKLDDHQKHVPEFFGHVELDKLVHQDHVTGGRNGQPFGDALNQAQERGLEKFDDVQERPPPLRRRRTIIALWADTARKKRFHSQNNKVGLFPLRVYV